MNACDDSYDGKDGYRGCRPWPALRWVWLGSAMVVVMVMMAMEVSDENGDTTPHVGGWWVAGGG